jgi:hypothetical protein
VCCTGCLHAALLCCCVPAAAAASPQAVTNPTNTVYATKRLIGRGFKDEQTQKEMKVRGRGWGAALNAAGVHLSLGCSRLQGPCSAAAGTSRRSRIC